MIGDSVTKKKEERDKLVKESTKSINWQTRKFFGNSPKESPMLKQEEYDIIQRDTILYFNNFCITFSEGDSLTSSVPGLKARPKTATLIRYSFGKFFFNKLIILFG